DMGFKEVYEVAKAAEYVTDLTRIYLNQPGVKLPAISSACPVVVRLIKLRFPTLCEQLIPILTPYELAGKFAREKVMREHPEIAPEDIRTVFISPCPAKVSWAKNVMEGQKVYVDHVVSMNDVYMELLSKMKNVEVPSPEANSEAGNVGLGWSSTGGEAVALMNDKYLAADGIDNVIKVLDDLESGTVSDINFVELNACAAGCVGGVMAPANGYIARVRLHNLRKTCAIQPNRLTDIDGMDGVSMPDELVDARPFTYMPEGAPNMLSMLLAMQKANALVEKLPNKDCGACGSPTCRAFAMDVVNGEAQLSDCKIRAQMEGS
ncbi:MAG: ferredoxin, partial [Clostridia bacterium]|nr:ferredoxin [Clostridia bacterium]